MYSKYDEAQFHLRLPHELHAKIKQRAKMNNRSLNSEIIAAIEESLAKQSSASVYIDDAERMAEQQSDMVKKMVFETLKTMYSNNKKETYKSSFRLKWHCLHDIL
ncbi:TPA: Arc family DNA-binding protein [Escherichia coli]|nr:Arc family DNA-binding protein [Escherichia coli]